MAWLKPIIGKWQFVCGFHRSMYYFKTWEFSIAVINFTNLPKMGVRIGLDNHRGLGITIQLRPPGCTFRRRLIWKRRFILGRWMFHDRWVTYPIRLNFKRLLEDVRIW